MPTNPQEAAATRAKALLLDLPWIFGIEKADQKPLEQAITAALTEARSAALKEAMDRIATIEFELADALAALLPASATGEVRVEPGSRELDALEALGDMASWFVDFVDESDRKRWPALVRAHEVLGWPLPASGDAHAASTTETGDGDV